VAGGSVSCGGMAGIGVVGVGCGGGIVSLGLAE